MKRRDPRLGVAAGLLAAVLGGLCGCTGPQVRSQCEDEPDAAPRYPDVKTVGDVTDFGNAEALPVGGVGLVEGLDGTGGDAPPGGYRSLLESELKKRNVRDLKEKLASPENAVVVVSGSVPPGARKGDPIDVEVTLPPGSKATSLRGGRLTVCVLYNYDTARHLSPTFTGPDRALQGHPVGRAEGSLLVGLGDGDEAAKLKQARIWGGGRCGIDRPLLLYLKADKKFASVASAVADRINERFHGGVHGVAGSETAIARDKEAVLLNVPPQYRHNLPRYMRVVRLIPLRQGDDRTAAAAAAAPRVPYRQRLEEDLVNPTRTVTAALRLEALGKDTAPVLKSALELKHPLVRFCAAEALAYLDEPVSGPELARMVEEYAVLRAFGLTALASMDEAVCYVKLGELLASAQPETRYGAFRALRALNDRDPVVQGELLNGSFWLHRVAPNSPPLVHLSSTRRAEIVLFGEDTLLKPPFSFLAGEYVVTSGDGDERCTITRYRGRRVTRQCSQEVGDVLRTLAGMGGLYPEAVELLRQAHACQCLSCRVAVDALPQAVSVHELARTSRDAPELLRPDAEVIDARPDLGATPTLYQKTAHRPRADAETDEEAMLRDRKAKDERKSAERRPKPGE